MMLFLTAGETRVVLEVAFVVNVRNLWVHEANIP